MTELLSFLLLNKRKWDLLYPIFMMTYLGNDHFSIYCVEPLWFTSTWILRSPLIFFLQNFLYLVFCVFFLSVVHIEVQLFFASSFLLYWNFLSFFKLWRIFFQHYLLHFITLCFKINNHIFTSKIFLLFFHCSFITSCSFFF